MTPISLNVGPSQISDAVARDIEEIARSGLLSESHRGPVVQAQLRDAVSALREAFEIPDTYEILFQPSATAAMETALRNGARASTFHFVQGAFSGRFAATADRLGLRTGTYETQWHVAPVPLDAVIDEDVELISVAHAETSAGQMWPREELAALRARHPEPLLCVDVTSSFGAMVMDWTIADYWFGSVQKCLGLPSGLGFAIVLLIAS